MLLRLGSRVPLKAIVGPRSLWCLDEPFSQLGVVVPSLGWAVTTMASVAKIVVPVLLAGESVSTLGLWLFRAPVMSLRGEILDFLTEPLV
jgi:hypothetical protein